MANISKELYDNLGKLLRFFRQPFPPGAPAAEEVLKTMRKRACFNF